MKLTQADIAYVRAWAMYLDGTWGICLRDVTPAAARERYPEVFA